MGELTVDRIHTKPHTFSIKESNRTSFSHSRHSRGAIKSASQLCRFLDARCCSNLPNLGSLARPVERSYFLVFHLPPPPCDLEPVLEPVAVATLNLARTDGQFRGQGAFVIQKIRVVGDVAKADTNRGLGVGEVGLAQSALAQSASETFAETASASCFSTPGVLCLGKEVLQ